MGWWTVVVVTSAAALALNSPLIAQTGKARAPAPVVFFDIAGPDGAKQATFYEQIFGWKTGPGGVLSVPVHGPALSGALRTDPAAKVIYIGVPDIGATQQEIISHGGKIVASRFEVKGVAVLALFTDPAGNSMGLVELTADGRTKVP